MTTDAKTFPPTRFQSFEATSTPANVAPRLNLLRDELGRRGLDALLVPRADAHRGESVPPGEARLAWLTGFTGSAGIAVVGRDRAALFIDSRYTIQAPAQTDTSLVDVHETSQGGMPAGIADYVPDGGRLAYDPWLHTPGEITDLFQKLDGRAELVPVDNPIDAIWADRPAAPASAIEMLGPNRAGRAPADKLEEIRKAIAAEKADVAVLTLPESICWLFNLRARDVPNTPFVLGFALVPREGEPTLFIEGARITDDLTRQLAGIVTLADRATFAAELADLGTRGKAVLIDPATAPKAVATALSDAGARLVERRDPVLLPKARKNEVELSGMREAQRLDGIALAKFLRWFSAEAPGGRLTEIGIVTALEAFRREEESCVDASFDTISGAGPNGAMNHYRVTTETDRSLRPGELMLVDSGGQYLSGTTDVTRTMSSGPASAEQKDRFTRVLKGMIGISTARFPKNTSGAQLDILARRHLWQVGQTYNHGTGHGVGHFLGVHEGPTGISPRYTLPLEPGMVLSNEPGFYKTGEYGIRIENLVAVIESPDYPGYFEFETLTLVPIDRALIEPSLLDKDERDWLDAYHARVRKEIGPLLDAETRAWLDTATASIG